MMTIVKDISERDLLPKECRARGCCARHTFLIHRIADGVHHWNPADPKGRYGAMHVPALVHMRHANPALFAQFIADLAERAHHKEARRMGDTGSVVFDEWSSDGDPVRRNGRRERRKATPAPPD